MSAAYLQHWFISDLHIGHKNILRHDGRPFDSIWEHDACLAQNCAMDGELSRTLWLLGDVATRVPEEVVTPV